MANSEDRDQLAPGSTLFAFAPVYAILTETLVFEITF